VGQPVAGEIVVIPFPRADGSGEKRRPALVIADLPGADLILCQIHEPRTLGGCFRPFHWTKAIVKRRNRSACFIRPHAFSPSNNTSFSSQLGK